MEHKLLPFALATLDFEGRTIEGYAATFGNLDRVKDIIHPGAFTKTLNERGNKVRLLWQHDQKEPIGRPLEIREDDRGLFIKAVVSDTARGRDALALLKDGAVDSMSIGYETVNADFGTEGKETIRNLRELKLFEVSLVTMPANELAQVTAIKAVGPSEGKPWNVFRRGDEFCVFKIDADDQPTGEAVACHPTEDEARAQVQALFANEPEAGKAEEPIMEEKVGRAISAKNRARIGKWLEALATSVGEIRGLLDETDPAPREETSEEPEAPEKAAPDDIEAKAEDAGPDATRDGAPPTEQVEAERMQILTEIESMR